MHDLAIDPASREYEEVVGLARGDPDVFSRIFHWLHGSMLVLARRYVRDWATAEDVAHETWLAVLKGVHRFEGRGSLKSWILCILVNRSKTRAMREDRQLPLSSLFHAEGFGGHPSEVDRILPDTSWNSVSGRGWSESPEEAVENAETIRWFLAELEKLPTKEREVVRLRDVQGWRPREVCEELGVSDVYQRVLLHRGRSRLRPALREYLESPRTPRSRGDCSRPEGRDAVAG